MSDNHDPGHGPDPQRPWPPPYKRQPMSIVATIVAVIAGVLGLGVIAFFVLMAIALASYGNTK
jgi:hypothetical protein